ncbi:MAG: hypothetical protein WBL63_24980 [Candidatus Acidiferrum sp.]
MWKWQEPDRTAKTEKTGAEVRRRPDLLYLSVLRLGTAVRSDGVRHAEDGRENLKNNAAVKEPKYISDYGGQQREEPLHRSLLERQDDPGDSHNEPDEQMERVQELRHSRSGPGTKRKIHQAFPHSLGFRHVFLQAT